MKNSVDLRRQKEEIGDLEKSIEIIQPEEERKTINY